jgi:hypothetical protein
LALLHLIGCLAGDIQFLLADVLNDPEGAGAEALHAATRQLINTIMDRVFTHDMYVYGT